MQKIKLVNPIKINGKEVKELPFDTQAFGVKELERANKMSAAANQGVAVVQETDYNYHMTIAKVIVESSSQGEIAVEDLDRLRGVDLFNLQQEGRNFLLGMGGQKTETLDAQSEITADSTEVAR
jgi:hypothetical protein